MFATRQAIARTKLYWLPWLSVLLPLAIALSLSSFATASSEDTQVSSTEGESFSHTGQAEVVSGLAYASGGSALRLHTNAVATKTVTVPAATSLAVRARKGAECAGTAPHMTVKLDGARVVSADVTATNLSSDSSQYRVDTKVTSGSHTFTVVNDTPGTSCDRPLRVDVVVLEGAAPPPSSGSCSSSASFSAGSWPPACWRPFDVTQSPFYKTIPTDPKVSSRSAQMVNRLFERGGFNPTRAGVADTSSDYYHAFFYATDADPLYTVHGGSTTEPYAISGKQVRLPVGSRPAGGSDGGMSVVWNGYYWGFGGATVDDSARTITVSYGRKLALGGNGLHAAETATKWPSVAGYVRYPELAAGEIDHALFFATSQAASSYVYPADASDGNDSATADYPPEGTRFQLDPSYMTDARIATYPEWKRAILRAMRDYGFFLSDSTSSPIGSFRIESGSTYTSFGRPDPFVEYGKANGVPSYYDSSIGRTLYLFDLQSGVDWTKLRAIEPCVSQGTC